MSIADELKSGTPEAAPNTPGATLEGATGQELALALQAGLQAQVNALATLAQEYQAGVDLVSKQLAPFFTQALSGQALMGAVLGRVDQDLKECRPMEVATSIQAPEVALPPAQGFDRKAIEAQFAAFIGPSNVRPVLPRLIQGGN